MEGKNADDGGRRPRQRGKEALEMFKGAEAEEEGKAADPEAPPPEGGEGGEGGGGLPVPMEGPDSDVLINVPFLEGYLPLAREVVMAATRRALDLVQATNNPMACSVVAGTYLDKLLKLQDEMPGARRRLLPHRGPHAGARGLLRAGEGTDEAVRRLTGETEKRMQALQYRRRTRRTVVHEEETIVEVPVGGGDDEEGEVLDV